MCFEVPALVPAGAPNVNKNRSGANDPDDDDLNLMDPDGNDIKPGTVLMISSCAEECTHSFSLK
jgi:hypothetical protein